MNGLMRGLLAALAILLLAAAPVAAGGWASITPDDGSADAEPVAGEPLDLGFTVLQHGQTPASWVTATVVLTNAITGDRVTAEAAATGGDDGHFVASVTVPDPGLWTWRVDLAELESDQAAVSLAVGTADGNLPAVDAATAVGLVEQAKSDLRTELRAEYGTRLDVLQREVDAARTQESALLKRVVQGSAERDALRAELDGRDGATPLSPVLVVGVVSIAVLAAALTAFAMLWLARPATPVVPAAEEPASTGFVPTR